MAKRLDAFMTEKDQQDFLKFAVLEKEVILLDNRGKEISLEEAFKEESIAENNKIKRLQALTFKDSKIVLDKYNEIDYEESEVVGFSKGYTFTSKLVKIPIREVGGLGIRTRYWSKNENGEDIIVLKDKRNNKFYNSLARWMKKNYIISTDKKYYAAPDFYRKYKKGEINTSAPSSIIFE